MEKDNHKAKCIVCGLTFELSNMGKQALISHSKGKKHVEKMKYASKTNQQQQQPKSFFVSMSNGTQSTDTTLTEDLKVADPPTGIALASTTGATLTQCISRDDVLNAEVLWTIKTVMLHYSMNSSSNTGELFKMMFPDSQIAQKFSLGRQSTHILSHMD